jgi:hypothetical protein
MPMLLLAHEVAGRLRFVSPDLRSDHQKAGQLLRLVRAVRGVTDVWIRNRTGSLIVLYDGALGTRVAVLESLPVAVPLNAAQIQNCRLLDKLAETATQKLLTFVARRVIATLL